MVDLRGHEAGNGGYSQRKPTAHRDSSTRKLVLILLRGNFDGQSAAFELRSAGVVALDLEKIACNATHNQPTARLHTQLV